MASASGVTTSDASKAMSLSGGVGREPELPKLLGSSNYHMWSRRLKAALKARGVWDAVETSEVVTPLADATLLADTLVSHRGKLFVDDPFVEIEPSMPNAPSSSLSQIL